MLYYISYLFVNEIAPNGSRFFAFDDDGDAVYVLYNNHVWYNHVGVWCVCCNTKKWVDCFI